MSWVSHINLNGEKLDIRDTVARDSLETINYTIKKQDTAEDGYSTTYQLYNNDVAIGEKINIPKDLVVESGSVEECTEDNSPVDGYNIGDKYIDLVIANSNNKHIYILVTDLVDTYTLPIATSTTLGGVKIDDFTILEKEDGTIYGAGADITGKSYNVSGISKTANIGAEVFNVSQRNNADSNLNVALGKYSHAEGSNTIAYGNTSHTEGASTTTHSSNSHAEGYKTVSGFSDDLTISDELLTTWGTTLEDITSINDGSAPNAHSEGANTYAIGTCTHSEGNSSVAIGSHSHAEGYHTVAIGDNSHSEGIGSKALGDYSHAEGFYTQSTNAQSHAEGYSSIASGLGSHSEGYFIPTQNNGNLGDIYTQAIGEGSHAEGTGCIANGLSSHAEGYNTQAISHYSHSSGIGTIANGEAQTTIGRYNLSDENNQYAFIIGNGTKETNEDTNENTITRSNALTIDWNGNTFIMGNLSVEGTIDCLALDNLDYVKRIAVDELPKKDIIDGVIYVVTGAESSTQYYIHNENGWELLNYKFDKEIDKTPTRLSENLVTSGGVYSALETKVDLSTLGDFEVSEDENIVLLSQDKLSQTENTTFITNADTKLVKYSFTASDDNYTITINDELLTVSSGKIEGYLYTLNPSTTYDVAYQTTDDEENIITNFVLKSVNGFATVVDELNYLESHMNKLSNTVELGFDSALSDTSTNAVQNKVVKSAIDDITTTLGDVQSALDNIVNGG
jgi:hypothetical protein